MTATRGQSVELVFAASDPNDDAVVLGLDAADGLPSDAALGAGGVVTFTVPDDADIDTVYNVEVRATDSEGASSSAVTRVTVVADASVTDDESTNLVLLLGAAGGGGVVAIVVGALMAYCCCCRDKKAKVEKFMDIDLESMADGE